MLDRSKQHESCTKKENEDDLLSDRYGLFDEYPDYWKILIYKSYQSVHEVLRATTPKTKLSRSVLRKEDEISDRSHASDRIIIENYFGRLANLWTILFPKLICSEEHYDDLFAHGVRFTNFHISIRIATRR